MKAEGDGEAEVDLSHHCDRISVQSAGSGPVSTGPEHCIAAASLPQLDDGELHTARIVLARNTFLDPTSGGALGLAEEDLRKAPAPPSHRLMVFTDENEAPSALINVELDLRQLFAQMGGWDGKLHAGFTAGTGKAHASHAVESWSMWELVDKKEAAGADEGQSWWQTILTPRGTR